MLWLRPRDPDESVFCSPDKRSCSRSRGPSGCLERYRSREALVVPYSPPCSGVYWGPGHRGKWVATQSTAMDTWGPDRPLIGPDPAGSLLSTWPSKCSLREGLIPPTPPDQGPVRPSGVFLLEPMPRPRDPRSGRDTSGVRLMRRSVDARMDDSEDPLVQSRVDRRDSRCAAKASRLEQCPSRALNGDSSCRRCRIGTQLS